MVFKTHFGKEPMHFKKGKYDSSLVIENIFLFISPGRGVKGIYTSKIIYTMLCVVF